jgi:hypothetical protein
VKFERQQQQSLARWSFMAELNGRIKRGVNKLHQIKEQ